MIKKDNHDTSISLVVIDDYISNLRNNTTNFETKKKKRRHHSEDSKVTKPHGGGCLTSSKFPVLRGGNFPETCRSSGGGGGGGTTGRGAAAAADETSSIWARLEQVRVLAASTIIQSFADTRGRSHAASHDEHSNHSLFGHNTTNCVVCVSSSACG